LHAGGIGVGSAIRRVLDFPLEHTGPAEVLVNLHPEPPPFFSRFERLAEIVAADDDALAAGRARYRFYRERGYELRQHDWSQREG
jgi:DNA polymerase-3 subunit chi